MIRGAEVINELLKVDLIDEFIISIVPVLLGNGTRLFQEGRPEELLEVLSTKSFDTGLIQLRYRRKISRTSSSTAIHPHVVSVF